MELFDYITLNSSDETRGLLMALLIVDGAEQRFGEAVLLHRGEQILVLWDGEDTPEPATLGSLRHLLGCQPAGCDDQPILPLTLS